jgi:nucleotidyltransferase/DNA polymerase involved in DNA repair
MAMPAAQWLFLDLNAFFASCEQQEAPTLRGKPVIVVQTLTDSAVAIAASYAAKAFGIKTGTVVREARRLCPDVIPVQANHRLYTDYHERILKAVDTCLPVDKVMSLARCRRGRSPALAPRVSCSLPSFASDRSPPLRVTIPHALSPCRR